MGIFIRERGQVAAAAPTCAEFQLISVTADQLQRIIDDWRRTERALKELASHWERLWAQAQAVVTAQNTDELVRLGHLMTATEPNPDQLDLREEIFARINKIEYSPSMMHVAEMISLSQQSSAT